MQLSELVKANVKVNSTAVEQELMLVYIFSAKQSSD